MSNNQKLLPEPDYKKILKEELKWLRIRLYIELGLEDTLIQIGTASWAVEEEKRKMLHEKSVEMVKKDE